jgi:hypothetical protein
MEKTQMQARATFNSVQGSRTIVAGALVAVAMGLAAMGGYVAKDVFGTDAASVSGVSVGHPAAGSVLRQDNPVQAPATLPDWAFSDKTSKPALPIKVDDPSFYGQYLSAPERSTGHKELP